MADRGALSARRVDRHHLADRVSGEAKHRKGDDADDNHDADGLNCSTKNKGEHLIPFATSASCGPALTTNKGPGRRSHRDLECRDWLTLPVSAPSKAGPDCPRA